MKKFLGVLCTIVISLSGAHALDGDISFRHFSADNGLTSNSVRAICQDKYGFMWFGTDNGLCRFDGERWRNFRHNSTSADQFVSALLETDSCLFIGTAHGINVMRFANETFHHFNYTTEDGTLISSSVRTITSDHDGNMWIATLEQGLFCFNPKRNLLTQHAFEESKGQLSCVKIDRENQVWALAQCDDNSLWRLNKASGKFQLFKTDRNIADAYTISCDSKGRLWVGTSSGEMLRLYSDGRTETYAENFEHIHSIQEISNDHLLVGGDAGLMEINVSDGTKRVISSGANSIRFIYPIVQDAEEGLWIGTFYDGVRYVAPNTGRFAKFSHSPNENSVGGNIINHFEEDQKGNIWIASDDGALSVFDPITKRFTNYNYNNSELPNNNVHGLLAEGENIWIGTYTGGISRLNTKTGRWRTYSHIQSADQKIDATSCYSFFRDSHGTLWAGSLESICKYVPEKDCFERVRHIGVVTIDILEDEIGNIWFATQGRGLVRYNIAKNEWKRYRHSEDEESLADDDVNSLYISSDGQLFVATLNGVVTFDYETETFHNFLDELQGVSVMGMVEENDNFWFTSNRGLWQLTSDDKVRWFGKQNGLQSSQFLANAILKTSDGRIYVGTNYGVNSFFPHQLEPNRVAPKVIITDLEITNRRIEPGTEKLPFTLYNTDELHLEYNDNAFALQFSTTSFCMPEANRYAYRLDGFDRDWNYTWDNTRATYTNLSPGTYLFRVKGTNNDGLWSERETTLRIVINPPFYLSLPMKILYIVLFVVFVFLFVRGLQQREKQKHRAEIRRLKAEKEKEVRDAKISFFTMVAHEIRTPVSLIIGPLENLMKSTAALPQEINSDLNIIDRNAHRLLYLVNQLLDFRKVEQKSLVQHFALCNIHKLMTAVSERFMPTFKQNNVKFNIEYPDETFSAVVDSEAITKVISNLLTNAAKYTQTFVNLSCEPLSNGEEFEIRVKDDGRGIKPEDVQRIFQPFYQVAGNKPGTGIGLNIVKGIVDRHKGMVWVESDGEGKGSTFIVRLPINQPEAVVGEEKASSNSSQMEEDFLAEENTPRHLREGQGERPTILIVEDNEDLISFIAKSLERNYNVLQAKDGVEALEKIEKSCVEPAFILSDWMMPNMDGEELCRNIRTNQLYSHIPFVLLTAKTDTDSKIKGMDCGADAYIEKPFSIQYVEACIKNIIGMRENLKRKYASQPMEPVETIAPTPVDNEFLNKLQGIIEANFSNPDLNVNFIAEQMAMSRSSMFSKIKSLSGTTPNEMIMLVRLKKAAVLLREGKHQVSEVCYMVGFNSPSYFSKCFQKQFGIKPTDIKSNTPF